MTYTGRDYDGPVARHLLPPTYVGSTATMVKAVKAHALAHYEGGGWDVIVECWDDQQISDHLVRAAENGPVETPAQAIAAFEGVVAVWADQQADARNSTF